MMRATLLALCVGGAATAAGIGLDQSTTKTFTDCAAGGSSAQSAIEGTYLMTVTDEPVFLCLAASAATCAANGTKFSAGTVTLLAVPHGGLSVACRSAGASGDVQFTRATQ